MEYEKGQELTVDITDFGVEGQGIGRCGGFTLFVENTVPGDTVIARITNVKKNYALAEALEITEYSKDRIKSLCGSFSHCGGCDFLHISYEAELAFKKKSVNQALRRIGGFDFEIEEIIGMEEPYYYRNKAVYHFSEAEGNIKAGFYGKKSNRLANVDSCVMFGEENTKILKAFIRYMGECGASVYNPKSGKGLIKGLMIRRSEHSGHILVCVLAAEAKLPNSAGLVYHLTESVKTIRGIALGVSKGVRPPDKARFIWGDTFITDKIGRFTFKISALSFFQVNGKMTAVLYEKAAQYANLSKNHLVVDAYAGIGTISLFLSENAKEVIGIERSGGAVLDAEANAESNGASNARFICADAADGLEALAEEGTRPHVVVLDPPRSGCDESAIRSLGKLSPAGIVYVSCAPATLARDLKKIAELGYMLDKGVCIDMFPRCAHVETVVGLCRKDCM